MNCSLYNADRATHCKIVGAALAAAITIAGFAIATRIKSDVAAPDRAAVIKAIKPIALANRNAVAVVQ